MLRGIGAGWGRVLTLAGLLTVTTAAPAAAQAPVASWRLDEGSGRVAADSGALRLNGSVTAGDPRWIAGVEGSALRFNGSGLVALPDHAALEPARITVAAWVRRSGSPGEFKYVFSKGASTCLRSAYGLYTARNGGAAFYVAGDGLYTVSPQLPASAIWDGRWHRLTGSYDGARVRLFVDGGQVGKGTAAPTHIEYGLTSRAPYIGTYQGNCQLAFDGDIDEVMVWGVGLTSSEVRADADPPPTTPATGPIGPRPGDPGFRAGSGYSRTPARCTSVRVSRRTVPSRKRARITATVRRGSKRLVGARVVIRARHLRKVVRTDRRGRARFTVRAKRAQKRLTIRVAARKRTACSRPIAYVRVRRAS